MSASSSCLNALRLVDGRARDVVLRSATGYPLSPRGAAPLESGGAAKDCSKRIQRWLKPTTLGRRFLNDLQSLFLVTPRRASQSGMRHWCTSKRREWNDERRRAAPKARNYAPFGGASAAAKCRKAWGVP